MTSSASVPPDRKTPAPEPLLSGQSSMTGMVSTVGIAIGYHRHFIHKGFRANRPLRIDPATGFWHAHLSRLFGPDRTTVDRFAPDLAARPAVKSSAPSKGSS